MFWEGEFDFSGIDLPPVPEAPPPPAPTPTPPPQQEMEMYETGIEGESQIPTYSYRPKAPVNTKDRLREMETGNYNNPNLGLGIPRIGGGQSKNDRRAYAAYANGGLVDLLRRHVKKYQ
jgi:hypothetical protein